ncbi:MAG: glycosyltransferase family 39 protein [Acidobacteriia bacterium]|nr:glycosyltransferase family 39 protein [Terriglobia bacterium]
MFADLGILVALALTKLILHTLTNANYGFHRDELATIDDAHYLAWGYVAYPPLTPFVARIAFAMFGPSLAGLRFFAALSQSIAMVTAGLMARELGGRRHAQVVTAVAVAIAPISLAASTLFQYVAFDYLWWVLTAYFAVRLVKSENPRWWIPMGAVIGLGMMTKYTIAFYVAAIVAGLLLTRARRFLAGPWLWAGVALSLLIFLPNLLWQLQHDFISLEFLRSIHERDIRIGRTGGFLLDQFRLAANPFTVPLWLAGLYFYFRAAAGKAYRMLGWMAVVPVILFFAAQGRGYYAGPVYPILLAGGTVCWQEWIAALPPGWGRLLVRINWGMLAIGGALILALGPFSPVNSPLWNVASKINTDLNEEIGWPELVRTVAGIYDALPAAEKTRTGILAGNYGEAGAINLYGPSYGLPRAISGINSYWLRGYGDPAPATLIVIGYDRSSAERLFEGCTLAGQVTNAYGVRNEETTRHPDIWLCKGPRLSWPELWKRLQHFG